MVSASTLRRLAAERTVEGENAVSGSGNPVSDKDIETLRLKRDNKVPRKENGPLKTLGLLVRTPSARFAFIKSKDRGFGIKKACQP